MKVLVALQPLQPLTLFNLLCQSDEFKIVSHLAFICFYQIAIKVEHIFMYLSNIVFLFFILTWALFFCLSFLID